MGQPIFSSRPSLWTRGSIVFASPTVLNIPTCLWSCDCRGSAFRLGTATAKGKNRFFQAGHPFGRVAVLCGYHAHKPTSVNSRGGEFFCVSVHSQKANQLDHCFCPPRSFYVEYGPQLGPTRGGNGLVVDCGKTDNGKCPMFVCFFYVCLFRVCLCLLHCVPFLTQTILSVSFLFTNSTTTTVAMTTGMATTTV